MQAEYLDLGNKDVFNGQYMLAVFKITPVEGVELEDIATEVAAESSTGSSVKIRTQTAYSQSVDAIVYDIDKKRNLVYIAYPWIIFDRGGNIQNIITFIAGNIFGMAELKECKLLDVWFPPAMLVQYDGPSYTIDDMRNYLKVFDRPILGTIIKPKIGLTSTEYAELCYDFWSGGGDFVKNDEPQADQQFCPYEKMVDSIRMGMDKAEEVTGMTKVHSFNISAADFETMIQRAEYIKKVMKPGSYAFLIDGITAGWMAVQTIKRHYPDVFIHFHRAAHGAFTRPENPIGFSVAVLTKFARLAGASGIHTGTAGVGKMAGNSHDDIIAAKQALMLKTKGDFFEQLWGEIPATDSDMENMITKEELTWNLGARGVAKLRETNGIHIEDSDMFGWRYVKKSCPIISGGLNPILLPQFLDIIGTIDFITTMGAGVHSHPKGTHAGIKAMMQGYEAWKQKIPLEVYAEDKEELREALSYFSDHKTQGYRNPA